MRFVASNFALPHTKLAKFGLRRQHLPKPLLAYLSRFLSSGGSTQKNGLFWRGSKSTPLLAKHRKLREAREEKPPPSPLLVSEATQKRVPLWPHTTHDKTPLMVLRRQREKKDLEDYKEKKKRRARIMHRLRNACCVSCTHALGARWGREMRRNAMLGRCRG